MTPQARKLILMVANSPVGRKSSMNGYVLFLLDSRLSRSWLRNTTQQPAISPKTQ